MRLLSVLLVLLLIPLALAGSIEGDYAALMDIYEVTKGDNWIHNDGWTDMTPATMNQAYGIETDSSGRVTRVDLEINNLVNSDIVGKDRYSKDILELIPGREFPESVANLDKVKYFNIKGNQIAGPIPNGFMNMSSVEYLLLSGRALREPARNIEIHPGKDRHVLIHNAWTGSLPRDWSRLERLFAVEISHHAREHGLIGPLPQSLFDHPSVGLIVLYSNHFTGPVPEIANAESSNISFIAISGSDLEGPLPESWGYLSAPYGKYLRFNYNPGITGELPESWANLQNIRVFLSDHTAMSGTFPSFLFNDGNPSMNYFSVWQNIEGTLPDELPAENADFSHMSIFYLDNRGIPGHIPDWVANIRHVQFNLNNNAFSSMSDLFYDHNAPVYQRIRNFNINNNNLSGELPDVPFARVAFSGTVLGNPSSTAVNLDMDLGVVESGVIDQIDNNDLWFRDSSKEGEWSHGWIDYRVTIDPDGQRRSFAVPTNTNYEYGYIYPRQAVTVQGAVGMDYLIEPIVEGKVIRFKLGENKYLARTVTNVDTVNNQVILDRPIQQNVDGLSYTIHRRSSVWNPHFNSNNFVGGVPQSWEYIPSYRDVRLRISYNDLSGPLPNFSRIGENDGGSLDWLYYNHNRFVFRDIIPYFSDFERVTSRHYYTPQKPFGPKPWGEQRVVRVEEGSDLLYSELTSYVSHPNNVYQWQREGSDLSGQDDVVLRINGFSATDKGEYRLRVTNPQIPDLILYSEDILVELGEPGEIEDDFDTSLYSSPRSGFIVDDRVRVQDTAIYNIGYYSHDGRDWVPFSFSGEEKIGDWVIGRAQNTNVPVNARYYAIFSCSWVGSWDCEDAWQVLEK